MMNPTGPGTLTDDERAAPDGTPESRAWLAAELQRLQAFVGDDAPTDTERRMLAELAARANARGVVIAARREIAAAVGIAEREVGHGIAWAEWRGSFDARPVSRPGAVRVDRYRLHRWPNP